MMTPMRTRTLNILTIDKNLCWYDPWDGVDNAERPDDANDAERTQGLLGLGAQGQRVADGHISAKKKKHAPNTIQYKMMM